MKAKPLNEMEKNELVERIEQLQNKINKKNQDLTKTRKQLAFAKTNVQRLKGIVTYQRQRIVQLHS